MEECRRPAGEKLLSTGQENIHTRSVSIKFKGLFESSELEEMGTTEEPNKCRSVRDPSRRTCLASKQKEPPRVHAWGHCPGLQESLPIPSRGG